MSSGIKTAAAMTVGCRLNQADTALIFGRLREAGYEIVGPDTDGPLDVIIINSCAVTASASQTSRNFVRACRRNHPEAKVIVTGCDSEVEKEFWQNEKSVDIYLPNPEKSKIMDYINGPLPKREAANEKIFMENSTGFYPFRCRAFIKIQEGCDNFCTYCIVPYARGSERSRHHAEIITEFGNLLAHGHKEIVLAGVNVSAYRDNSYGLSELLSRLLEFEGDYRIRLSSTEPHKDNIKLIPLMKDNPKICRFLHLPLQHGSDEILKLMGRKYTAEEFAEFAHMALSGIPGLHLGTDVICGFPGETAELFEKSCRFMESIPFANLHVFSFSPRKGTPAADFEDHVLPAEMKDRHLRLEALEGRLADKFLDAQVGRTLKVLIEKVRHDGEAEGWSDNYIRVISHVENAKRNSFADVLIKEKAGKILKG
ncbi:MAG: tRNA (N(6)-L-threonylcarbamoyladenosine(37)-C(2))-methylthiotransferase MtaB [Lentisphaerae bacterium GWF2_50_93]|nr:MAG: tRNA (N(6)-L-threonylcarbamoyladenosine(37)-C(2))-methylthiotransferase MtaB [Lentisphaerae bacterium GWF2_50_93]